ncbi:MAG: collagenase [Candidatus Magasanikbacteria bacterium RIFOXYC2_FULL_40_16]|uniref:Collagenase n=2 Tax=Candidatus Magasanikiibacteriota TaxID=1752731 RepID=A0A1F6P1P2_9BACT|nr:MAG: collagenase [Candidatus Magasanikbacteria bacterium RIFOXYB2_FULL_40_13]OGH90061.1 MAG: collagenase [Candidatus Magasanikbacteria bacterium RIFOXYC2_FULL_40_16]
MRKIKPKQSPSAGIEIMSPAGSFASLHSAIQGGANSVYFGIEQLNMRARSANNFKTDDLPEIVRLCGESVKTYLTVNTILYDHDLILMKKIMANAKSAGVTAVIASDMAALQYGKDIGLEVHISTQQNVSNIEAVKFFAQYSDVIVLARELTLGQIKQIIDEIKKQNIKGVSGQPLRIEIFAHGALCVAVSGKCYMSLAVENTSANRGACAQICRRSYRVTDEETGDELVIDNKYIMSPADLCTIGFLDKLLDAGVSVLKLEGRGRSPDYVYTVTKCYREAADAVANKTYTKEKISAWTKELESVYNRGFWHGGYYMGKKLGDWSGQYGSHATKENIFLGQAKNYFVKKGVAEFLIETGEVKNGDDLLITGETTGVMKIKLADLQVDGHSSKTAKKGDLITFAVPDRIRKSDKLFVVRDR